MTPTQIKAMRVKLAAKRTGGSYKKVVRGRVITVKPFSEALHPRGQGGKFASKPGSGKRPIASREQRLHDQHSARMMEANNKGNRGDKERRAENKKLKEYREKSGFARGGKLVDHRVPGKLAESRLSRAKELRAQRAAKQAKPSRPSQTERASRIVKKLDDRSSKMDPATIEKRLNRVGSKVNADAVSTVEKNLLGANVGKTKADKLAKIREAIYNRRKSRDRAQSIMRGSKS